jgi:membrane fusion protein (multidrug efflux system)
MEYDANHPLNLNDHPGSDESMDFLHNPDEQEADQEFLVDDSAPPNDTGGPNRPRRILARFRRHPALAAALLLALIGVAYGGWRFWNYLQSYADTDDAEVGAHIDPISPRISATVIQVLVDDNQRVEKGQLLVQLDPRDYQVALAQARANLDEVKAQVNAAQQQYVSALAKVRQAQAQNALAQSNERRYATLFRLGVAAPAEYQQYQATARVQMADVKADQADAASALRTVASRQAQVEAAQAQVNQAELNLSYTKIVAPAAGIIGKRTAEVGEAVTPGQGLMALTELNDIWVTANFKETEIARMRPGEPVTIHVDALGRNFRGYVERMPGATGSEYALLPPENATGNYVKVVQRLPVRIKFDAGQDLSRLRPGMSVEPTVWLK